MLKFCENTYLWKNVKIILCENYVKIHICEKSENYFMWKLCENVI